MIRKLLIFIAIVSIIALAVGAWLWRDYSRFTAAPLMDSGTGIVWIRSGDTMGSLVSRLEQLGLATPGWQWRLLGRFERPVIKAGEYLLRPGESPISLLARLDS